MDVAEKMYFQPLADSRTMPMNYGKELKVFYYVPLLDDRNVSDQGIDANGAQIDDGNLYGSSKDIGRITGRMPTLSEEGGRVNRVGFTRIERTGRIQEYGFFTDFTEDSMMFDTDDKLYEHMSREMLTGANEITEALLQTDLLNAAATLVYTGTSTTLDEMTGEGVDPSVVTYLDLKRLSIALDENLTPKDTKVIKGSRMIDTRTVNSSRMLYIGSELQITIENMVDGLGNPAYVPIRKYADASMIMNGELGSIGDFRIIIVPEMQRYEGAGAAVVTNPGFAETGGNYDVYPMLVVGSGSFATVGLQSSGKKMGKQKFRIIVKKPGMDIATIQDPYGKVGFSSISFWHGFIGLHTERLAVVYTCAAE